MERINIYKEISAREAVENAKIGWNLGNALDSYGNVINPAASKIDSGKIVNYETAWGNPVITKEFIHFIKSLGFQGLRMPVTWGENLDADDNVKPEWMAHIKKIVGWALDEGFFVILNLHHDSGRKGWIRATKESFEKYKNRYAKLWTQIATEFESASEKLMFESFNEMLDGELGDGTTDSGNWTLPATNEGFKYTNEWNQLFVDTVRATGGNNTVRNLICNTYSAAYADMALKGFTLPKDTVQNHLICEVHNYNVDVSSLDDGFLRTALFGERVGCPVIIGEWGSSTDSSGSEMFCYLPTEEARAEHAASYISQATKRGFACYFWDDGNSYQLFDRAKCECIHQPIVDAIVKNVQDTVPLTDEEKNITEVENFVNVAFTVDDDLNFTWTTKPVITGDTSGVVAFGIFRSDWSETILWFEEPDTKMGDSHNLVERMIKWEYGVSEKSEIPEKMFLQIMYRYGDDKNLKIIEVKELTLKK